MNEVLTFDLFEKDLRNKQTVNGREKRTYRVEEIAEMLDIGRSSAYELVKKNLFKTVRIGMSIRISKSSFDEWLDSENK